MRMGTSASTFPSRTGTVGRWVCEQDSYLEVHKAVIRAHVVRGKTTPMTASWTVMISQSRILLSQENPASTFRSEGDRARGGQTESDNGRGAKAGIRLVDIVNDRFHHIHGRRFVEVTDGDVSSFGWHRPCHP